MLVDALTTAAVADNLRETILGGRVQDIIEVDQQTIGMEVYAGRKRHYLLATVAPGAARCHLVTEKLRRGVERPSALGLLLRKYVEGAHLEAVSQPPHERVLWLDFSSEQGETRLIVETMDRRSNVLLVAEEVILDCLKRVGPDQNRYRVMLPGKPYVPPPAQDKPEPERLTPGRLEALLRRQPDQPVWRVLVAAVRGISPLSAREIVHRATGDPAASAFDVAGAPVCEALHNLLANAAAGRWSPCVARAPEGRLHAFAAYHLSHLSDVEPRDSISAAMTDYFGAPAGEQGYEPAKLAVRSQLHGALERVRRKEAALKREERQADEIEALRKKGELIFAYAAVLEQGQTRLEAQYEVDGPTLIVELDPALTPAQNARRYFDRYEKARRATAEVPQLQAAAEKEIAYLEQLQTDLDLSENWPEIDAVRRALQESGYWQGSRTTLPRGGKPGIRRLTTADGYVLLIGRNAEQNNEIITRQSSPQDLWLHARGIPGSHVLIKNDGRPIPETVIALAAGLAAYYSAGRGNATVEVDLTERRYVRPLKGGRPGMVTYKRERTLAVKPVRPGSELK